MHHFHVSFAREFIDGYEHQKFSHICSLQQSYSIVLYYYRRIVYWIQSGNRRDEGELAERPIFHAVSGWCNFWDGFAIAFKFVMVWEGLMLVVLNEEVSQHYSVEPAEALWRQEQWWCFFSAGMYDHFIFSHWFGTVEYLKLGYYNHEADWIFSGIFHWVKLNCEIGNSEVFCKKNLNVFMEKRKAVLTVPRAVFEQKEGSPFSFNVKKWDEKICFLFPN